MSQKLKRNYRNQSAPILEPLPADELEFIRDTVLNQTNLPSSGHLGKEFDDGHIEFKWKLINPGPDRMQHLITQMGYRFGEAENVGIPGVCHYQIGVEDCGYPRGLSDDELVSSISTVFLMAKQLDATVHIECIKQGVEGKVATLTVRRSLAAMNGTTDHEEEEKKGKEAMASNDIRLAIIGASEVGKSTLIGVLTRGRLDDGHGSARMNVFRHRHEVLYGRTSSISRHILGFDESGTITNYRAFHQNNWHDIVRSSTKLVTFVDHPGHRRHFSTSLRAFTSHKPHYVMLTVSLDEFDRKDASNLDAHADQEWSQMLSLNLDGLLDANTSSSDCDSESDSESNTESDRETGALCHSDSAVTSSADDKHDNATGVLGGGGNGGTHSTHSGPHRKSASSTPIRRDLRLQSADNVTPQKSIDPSGDYAKYLTMCDSINVPPFICISKSDIDAQHSYTRLPKMVDKISKVVADKCGDKMTVKVIRSPSEASRIARALSSSSVSVVPIIVTSCVNGEGLDLLKTFLFSLQSHVGWQMDGNLDGDVEVGIDDIFDVHSVGVVVSGIVRSGTVRVGDTLSIGPSKLGQFRKVTIGSIHVRRKATSYAFPQQMASFRLTEVATKDELRRGMVLVDTKCDTDSSVCYSFEADIDVLTACALREGSQPIVHVENIRQSAHILHLHSGDVDEGDSNGGTGGVTAVFTFLHCPEFIRRGMKIIIRKSHGPIAIGRVSKLLDSVDRPLVPLNSLQKPQRFRTSKHKTDFKHYLRKWSLDHRRNGLKEEKKESVSERELFSTTDDDAENPPEIHWNRSMESVNECGPKMEVTEMDTNISTSSSGDVVVEDELDESKMMDIKRRRSVVMEMSSAVDRKHDENLIGNDKSPRTIKMEIKKKKSYTQRWRSIRFSFVRRRI